MQKVNASVLLLHLKSKKSVKLLNEGIQCNPLEKTRNQPVGLGKEPVQLLVNLFPDQALGVRIEVFTIYLR